MQAYIDGARKAISNPVLQTALANLQERLGKGAAVAYRNLAEGPGLRHHAHELRMQAVGNLDVLLEMLVAQVEKNGGRVIFADDAKSAVDACRKIARKHGARSVVKGKSMVTEEIGLNASLIADGLEVTETDLGEFIVQLAAEHPSHIIAPAIHKTRSDIGTLFAEKLGIPYSNDAPTLTWAARKALRAKFLAADMGITGCNLACAETGHIAILSNEGNIRMAATLPAVHVAIMGMERVAATLADHDVLLRLLSRGAAGQRMAGYVSHISGPRRYGDIDGPESFYLIILDNGRSRILADRRFREILCCIRCGACLNVCPVYAKIGGHAYGATYCGPIGAVVSPLLSGINRFRDLCLGETLCGACRESCPVQIDIPRMLLELRSMLADGDAFWRVRRNSLLEKAGWGMWSWVMQDRRRYEIAAGLMKRIFP